ncbi:hypothetical protein [Pontibacter sp. SGAir0037]|uniref:hypothetical protein n=1 Tax=Pontibacter sp. SGAir0037 TaxID=2571030 RepID=UPI0010CD1CA7|nr:hypothetical protein [Pontibacter sp. SGAir0037]QCR24217.1 hypothetical protein C1N53_18895 [Pontibacter sp. SGAir0037]
MYKFIFKLALTLLVSNIFYLNVHAQIAIVGDVQGRPAVTRSFTDIQGSAYLYDSWEKGKVKMMNGTIHDNMELMYDQVNDELIFKGLSNQPQTFLHPVHEFTISKVVNNHVVEERKFRKGFSPVDGANNMATYEVLAEGNTLLLKRTAKVVFEDLPYGSSTKVKTIRENTHYYIAVADKLVKIKNDKKSVLQVLNSKSTEIDRFIKENKINFKDDADLSKLIAYYNTL